MKTEVIEVLSAVESAEFLKLDATIKAGAKTFMEVGHALVKVHEGKLYRAEFGTFKAYAESRGISAKQTYNLMNAVQLTMQLEAENKKVNPVHTDSDRKNIEDLKRSSAKAILELGKINPKKRSKTVGIRMPIPSTGF